MVLLAYLWKYREWVLLALLLSVLALFRADHRRSRGKIEVLQGLLLSKPQVETKTVTRLLRGPERVVVRTIYATDGSRTVEKTLSRESSERVRGEEARVTPAALVRPDLVRPEDQRFRYVGAASNPFKVERLRLGAGLAVFRGRLDVGGYWDTYNKDLGVETRWRF